VAIFITAFSNFHCHSRRNSGVNGIGFFEAPAAMRTRRRKYLLPGAQLWGYSANGALTDSVQVPPEFLRKKSQKNLAAGKLSNEVTMFGNEIPRPL